MNKLENIPPELFAEIALSLPYPDLENLCNTNPRIRQLCNNDQFWYQRTIQDFGNNTNKPNDINWKEWFLISLEQKRERRRRREQIKHFDEVERPQLLNSTPNLSGNPMSGEMVYELLLSLDLRNIRSLCQTNRTIVPFCKSQVFWYDKILHDFPSINPNQLIDTKPGNLSWLQYYNELINKK